MRSLIRFLQQKGVAIAPTTKASALRQIMRHENALLEAGIRLPIDHFYDFEAAYKRQLQRLAKKAGGSP